MYADNARISHRQLFRQTVTALLGVYFFFIPMEESLRGRQGVLCLVSASLLYLFLIIYFIRIRNFFSRPEKYLGRLWGRIFLLLYVSWLWMAGICLLLLISRLTGRFLIEGSIPWLVILLSGLGAWLGSHQGLERRGRMGEVCFLPLLLILAGMLVLTVSGMKLSYLREMGPLSFSGWAEGTWSAVCLLLPFMFLPAALGGTEKPGNTGKLMGGSLFLLMGLSALSLVILQGSFGLGGYEHKDYPMVDLMSGVRLPGDFLQRVDVFWVAAALFSLLFALGSVFFYSHELLYRGGMEKGTLLPFAGMVITALACEYSGVSLDFFLDLNRRVYGPLLLFLLLAAGYFTGKRPGAKESRSKKTDRSVDRNAGENTDRRAGQNAENRAMMKVSRAMVLGLAAIVLTSLTGCGISLENRVFPLSFGADYREGHYQIIYGIPQLSGVTGQDKGDTEASREQAVVYKGLTMEDVEEDFQENQENYLDMGHIKVLLLGQGILENREALEGLLEYLEDRPSVAGNIYLFSCKDNEALMSLDGQEVDSVGDYLKGILENTLDKQETRAVTLQDYYNAWHRGEDFPPLWEVSVVNKKPQIRQNS